MPSNPSSVDEGKVDVPYLGGKPNKLYAAFIIMIGC